jgi:hypothetical protein
MLKQATTVPGWQRVAMTVSVLVPISTDPPGTFDAAQHGITHRSAAMQTDPTIDPVADPANQPLDEPEDQPRPLPGTLPRRDPLAPDVSTEDDGLGTDESLRPD